MAKNYILGSRGERLRSAQIWAVILPAYILFGWNNGVAGEPEEHLQHVDHKWLILPASTGPLLDLPSWIETFPRIDTVNTTGAQKTDNSRVQGTVSR